MTKNIDQLLIKIVLKGDVSGTLPIFNYNYNILNKNISKGGNIYLPNEIDLTMQLFKIKDLKNKEIVKKIREVFTSEESLKNLYKEYNDKLKVTNNELIRRNLEFIINLFFIKNEDFYLDGRKFKVNSIKNLTASDEDFSKKFTNKSLLLSKSCSKDKNILDKCSIENLENMLIESYKEKEIKFIKKIDPTLSDSEVDKKAYKEAIEKYKKGNQNDQIKNFANEIIKKENYKNDFKKAGLNYIFNDKRGIILDSKNNLIKDIIIELDLTYSANVVPRKKLHIERGNCKTKKKYIKNLWKKLTRKNKSTSIDLDKEKKWIYEKTYKGYELKLAKS